MKSVVECKNNIRKTVNTEYRCLCLLIEKINKPLSKVTVTVGKKNANLKISMLNKSNWRMYGMNL